MYRIFFGVAGAAIAAAALTSCAMQKSVGSEAGRMPTPAAAAGHAPRAVIVELFTSEGCSSCPPADVLLAKLARTQSVAGTTVIPLEEHVDYWDGAKWRDPFSSPLFTQRQNDYAQRLRQVDVYTPEMVVDGVSGFVGSDDDAAATEIRRAAQTTAMEITVDGAVSGTPGSGETVDSTVHVGAGVRGEVYIALTEDGLSSRVGGGENDGRTLQHNGVVRALIKVGKPDSQSAVSAKLALGRGWVNTNMHIVAFVQDGGGRILGAATSRLPRPS